MTNAFGRWETDAYEMDLAHLLRLLWQARGWLLLVTAAFAVGAAVLSLWVLKPQYQTTAVVAVQFPRVPSTIASYWPIPYSVPEMSVLLTSLQRDEILQHLAESEGLDAQTLRSRVRAETTGRYGVRLIVRDENPERAARIANRWAALVQEQVLALYRFDILETTWQRMLEQAEQDYRNLDEQVRDFWTRPENGKLATAQALNNYFHLRERLVLLQTAQDQVEYWQTRLNAYADDEVLPPEWRAQIWPLVLTNWRLLSSAPREVGSEGILAPPQDWRAGEARAALTRASQAIAEALQETTALQSEVAREYQGYLQALAVEEGLRMQRNRAWNTLVQLQDQAHWFESMRREGSVARLISPATPPATPATPRVGLNVTLAAALGLTLGVVAVVLRDWWARVASSTGGIA